MNAARFGTYVHSDATTPHKGAAIAVVTGGGDFAAIAARLSYGAGSTSWSDVACVFPEADSRRAELGADVSAVALVRLDPGQVGRVDVRAGDNHAVAVKVLSTTDFAAKTEGFKAFTAAVAAAALRHASHHWGIIAALEPRLESERLALARDLKEQVQVVQIEGLNL